MVCESVAPFFTVFTPTYNRRELLSRAYESLQKQSCKDFEWLIVDDGSIDGTREQVLEWGRVSPFPIRYHWQKNQHKKVAHNRAVENASGSLLVSLDSDDELLPDALEKLRLRWESIPCGQRDRFCGVVGLCVNEGGKVVGDRYWKDIVDLSLLEMTCRYRIRGDKAGAVRVDVLRAHLFPEDVAGLVPEAYIWDHIGERYLYRFSNDLLLKINASHGGSRLSNEQNSIKHAAGRLLYERQFFVLAWRWFRYAPLFFCKRAIQFARFHLHCGGRLKDVNATMPGYWLVVLTYPIGVALCYWDRWRS